ncbi:MAG: pilus assembly protein PilM, partial [Pirellulales bacterium]
MIARRKHGWIGIDFGTKVVKVAQLERAGEALRWRRAVIPRSPAAGGLACTGQELRQALEAHGGFQGRVAACTLPMSATELRAIAVPPGSEAERRAMIAQELEAAAVVNEPREFDFWQAGASNGAEQDGVQVLSVATAKVSELTDSLAVAGLECAVLDCVPCTLARAVALSSAHPVEGPLAAIDWGHDNATLSIVEGGRAQFTRPLRDCGAGGLFQEVCRTLGLDETEAIELLTRFGLPAAAEAPLEEQEIREVVVDIVGAHVQRMVDELTRTFAFFRLQRQSLLPRRACLFGAGATVKNVAAFVAAKLETPCEVWRLAAADDSWCGHLARLGESRRDAYTT